jgi:TDG/mug DNA glycosylase family protein
MLKGLAPITSDNATILILGSMPSVKSLEQQQYYGHPRNAFWIIMAAITELALIDSYEERCQALKQHGIALWDVIGECNRSGSLDSSIVKKSVRPNKILEFIKQHPKLHTIALNGGTAFTLFKKYFLSDIPEHITIVQLPSTSPAYTLEVEKKINIWLEKLKLI